VVKDIMAQSGTRIHVSQPSPFTSRLGSHLFSSFTACW
jgi:hypothetical protein